MCAPLIGSVTPSGSKIDRFVCNVAGKQPPEGWYALESDDDVMAALTSKWVLHLGHGAHNLWGVSLSQQRSLDDQYVTSKSRDHWCVSDAPYLPVILSAGCATGQFLGNAPVDGEYRASDGSAVSLVFDKTNKTVADSASPGTRHSWPVRVPVPHAYDFPNVGGRTFAHAWLCGSGGGGAIAYVGATIVHQGGTYSVDLMARMLRHVGTMNILGDIWAQAARDYYDENLHPDDILGSRRIFLGVATLFGDPSLRLS